MSQYLDWHVGMKVVFLGQTGKATMVRRGWRRYVPFLNETTLTHNLVAGEVYTVEGIATHINQHTGQPFVAVFLRGFRFKENRLIAFPAVWFRRVAERKTDIGIFTAMLHRTDREVSA